MVVAGWFWLKKKLFEVKVMFGWKKNARKERKVKSERIGNIWKLSSFAKCISLTVIHIYVQCLYTDMDKNLSQHTHSNSII